jgi:glycosyltransferase involved in cell wall biosynthesis
MRRLVYNRGMVPASDIQARSPRVSVVVPSYNHAPYLRRRLRSVLNQTYRDIEVIVLDDASTDQSAAIVGEFTGDGRLRFFLNAANSGSPFKQWNKGVGLARGEYVWIAESDDYADERFLERLVGMLESNPSCGMACCESWYVYGEAPPTTRTNESHQPENGRWREDYVVDGATECAEHLIRCNTMPNASAVVFRRALYQRVGGADESMRLCADWLLWVTLLTSSDLAHVGEPLNYYRCHTAAVRKQNEATATTAAEVYRIIARIKDHAAVAPQTLDEVLTFRAQRFVHSAVMHSFTAADAWTVYRAARKVDRHAFTRILLRWCRLRAGTALRRLSRAAT